MQNAFKTKEKKNKSKQKKKKANLNKNKVSKCVNESLKVEREKKIRAEQKNSIWQWKMEAGFQWQCIKVDRNVNLLVKIHKFLSQQIESRLLADFNDYFVICRFQFYCILYRDLFIYIYTYIYIWL